MTKRFELGKVVVSRGVHAEMQNSFLFTAWVAQSIKRHEKGDWGNLCEADKQVNERELKNGGRLLSAYEKEGCPKIFVITEAGRNITTTLLVEEY